MISFLKSFCTLIFFFQFRPSYYFFQIWFSFFLLLFYVFNSFFFQFIPLTFDLFKVWSSWFFQIWCFWSNGSSHEFHELRHVLIFFCGLIFFLDLITLYWFFVWIFLLRSFWIFRIRLITLFFSYIFFIQPREEVEVKYSSQTRLELILKGVMVIKLRVNPFVESEFIIFYCLMQYYFNFFKKNILNFDLYRFWTV
jgi:hypothetical protein